MAYSTKRPSSWDGVGKMIASIVATEVALVCTSIVHPTLLGAIRLGIAAPLGIVSIVLLSRAHAPIGVKAALISLVCLSLFLMAALQDVLGLQAMGRDVQAAIEDKAKPLPVNDNDSSLAESDVHIFSDPGADPQAAQMLSKALSQYSNGVRVEGRLHVSEEPGARLYELDWAIVRRDDTRIWCGKMTAFGDSSEQVLSQFASRIAAVTSRLGAKPTSCL